MMRPTTPLLPGSDDEYRHHELLICAILAYAAAYAAETEAIVEAHGAPDVRLSFLCPLPSPRSGAEAWHEVEWLTRDFRETLHPAAAVRLFHRLRDGEHAAHEAAKERAAARQGARVAAHMAALENLLGLGMPYVLHDARRAAETKAREAAAARAHEAIPAQ